MKSKRIGIIGGSGLYEMEALEVLEKARLETPFGDPSDEFILGKISGREVVFLARHGKGHRLLPSEINFRANMWGMKILGVEQILSVSAVGSLKEEIHPGDFVLVDQFIDRTFRRPSTFFGEGVVAHVALAEPVCSRMRQTLSQAIEKGKFSCHAQGTYVCIEGPQFSTRAESHLYRSWGADVIGMTNVTEAKLAREAQICYVTLALATDYDCWHPRHDSVTTEQVLATLFSNVEKAKNLIATAIPLLSLARDCSCAHSLKHAIATDRLMISDVAKRKIQILTGK